MTTNVKATLNKRANIGDGDDPNYGGAGCKVMHEELPNFAEAPCEDVWVGQNNSYIVLGRDRPAGITSGAGGGGETRCGMIDLVAGRNSANIINNIEGKQINTNPSFKKDAARVYITQKAKNIDEYLDLQGADEAFNFGDHSINHFSPQDRSAVAIKADDVRIVARESIKIVTGVDHKDSHGGHLSSRGGGIDLIGGGIEGEQQPLVKGHALKTCLLDIYKQLDDVVGMLNTFVSVQTAFNRVVANHKHKVTIEEALGRMTTGKGSGELGGVTNHPDYALAFYHGPRAMIQAELMCKKDAVIKKGTLGAQKIKYLELPCSMDNILSTHNTTN